MTYFTQGDIFGTYNSINVCYVYAFNLNVKLHDDGKQVQNFDR